MSHLIALLHGILTRQTDPSWPDRFDAWLSRNERTWRVVKKEYAAAPFPRWNCWVKNPRLARGLANEIALFLESAFPARAANTDGTTRQPEIWFVAHSNGAVIALLTARRLIERGITVGGLVLTGAACEADITRNGILEWLCLHQLGAALAYSSRDDAVLAGDPRVTASLFRKIRDWAWGKLMWPYGCLGRTGWIHGTSWLSRAARLTRPGRILTRWFPGGHSAYFAPGQMEFTFEQIRRDIRGFSRRAEGSPDSGEARTDSTTLQPAEKA